MGRIFGWLATLFSKIASTIKRVFSPRKQSVEAQPTQEAVPTLNPESKPTVGGAQGGVGEAQQAGGSEILLGTLQTMVASPTAVLEQPPRAEAAVSEGEKGREEEYVPKIKPKPSPPLPKEHRELVRKLVRAGKRREAAAALEELGYLFAEVSTRGKYIVVKYRGRDGYLYAARIRYRS